MGGQACVFYGAAEFSRDTDLLILADPANLTRLKAALQHLQAERQEDRTYWEPLKAELERLRHAIRSDRQTSQLQFPSSPGDLVSH